MLDEDGWDDARVRQECTKGTIRELQAYLRAGYVLKPEMYPIEAANALLGSGLANDITIQDVIRIVSAKRQVSVQEILGRSQRREFSHARREISYICYNKLGKTVEEIAKALCRDHTTIVFHLKTYRPPSKLLNEQLRCELLPRS